jgi:hypothetical protein
VHAEGAAEAGGHEEHAGEMPDDMTEAQRKYYLEHRRGKPTVWLKGKEHGFPKGWYVIECTRTAGGPFRGVLRLWPRMIYWCLLLHLLLVLYAAVLYTCATLVSACFVSIYMLPYLIVADLKLLAPLCMSHNGLRLHLMACRCQSGHQGPLLPAT